MTDQQRKGKDHPQRQQEMKNGGHNLFNQRERNAHLATVSREFHLMMRRTSARDSGQGSPYNAQPIISKPEITHASSRP
ncbi:MAG TPA: hypothetical protein DCM39_15565 [Pantoea sp.]|nr:hypothetical protein [Pantoea sp.]